MALQDGLEPTTP